MRSPNHSYVAELDQLRGAAALLVFFYHSVHRGLIQSGFPDWPKTVNPFNVLVFEGHTGVALFMVLSGFVLARGTFGKEISYDFLRNRVLRIFPLMTVMVIFAAASTSNISLDKIASWFFFMGNTSAAFHDKAELVGTLWTLAVEFQFYLVAPFLFAFTDKKGILRFILPLMFFFVCLRLVAVIATPGDATQHYQFSYFTIFGRIDQFIIGVAMAYLSDQKKLTMAPTSAFVALILSTAALIGLLFLLNHEGGITSWHPWHIILPEIEALIWATFICAYVGARPLGVAGATLANLGTISFGMYVLHYSIQLNFWLYVYPRLGFAVHSPTQVYLLSVAILLPAILLASISWKCIEEPFNSMRGRYLTPRRSTHLDNGSPQSGEGADGGLPARKRLAPFDTGAI